MKFNFTKISIRRLIQISILFLIIYLAYSHQKFGIEVTAPIDAYCPFGALESFFTLIFKGEFLKRIFISSFILMGIFIVGNLLFGRVFCSYICPLGTLQELIRKLGRIIGFKKNYELPRIIDKYMRYVKYIVLILIVYYSFYLGDLIFRNYDPFNALSHLGNEVDEKIIGYSILIIIIIISLFTKNIWCRYFCPLGGFFGIINKVGFLKIKKEDNKCNECGVCNIQCPANINIKKLNEIKNADCISCGNCIEKCNKSLLYFTILNKRVHKKTFSILVVIIVVIPLILFPMSPLRKTKPESNIVNVLGEINPADIRGSNSLNYLIETTNIPLSEFINKFNLPSNIDGSIKLKEIKSKYGIETNEFRIFVDEYLKGKPTKTDCPFGEINCKFPGKCGHYIDYNKDYVCDHSQ